MGTAASSSPRRDTGEVRLSILGDEIDPQH